MGQEIASIDKAGRITRTVYDAVGKVIEIIAPDSTPNDLTDNPRTKTEYYGDGKIKATIDELGHRTEYRYDNGGRRIETIYADDTPDTLVDNPRTTYKHDLVGQRISETDALGHTTNYEYDNLGKKVKITYADGTFTTTTYDTLGRQIATTDQNGKQTEYRYDRLGHLIGVKNTLMDWTEYGYDETGNLIWIEDANKHRTRYEYNVLGQRIATILPMGQGQEITYDPLGNIQTTKDFNGVTISYKYDLQNRLAEKIFPDGTKTVFTYTITGHRQTVSDVSGTTVYEYDERDRLISVTNPDSKVVRYTYDSVGNKASLQTDLGTINYTYDVRNRLDTVTDVNGNVTDYDYDKVGNLIRTKLSNNTIETRSYNNRDQLVYLENVRGNGEMISSYSYTLDRLGNRILIQENNSRQVNYTYDSLSRLTQEKVIDGNQQVHTTNYSYDAVGNHLSRTDSSNGITLYNYDNNDRLLTETLNNQVTSYSYDNNGNTIARSDLNSQTIYDWNYENRLVKTDTITANETKTTAYKYNSDGIRVATIANGEETRYLVDAKNLYAQVIEEYRADGNVTASYVYGRDLVSQHQDGSSIYYHVDGLGSTRVLTDFSGNVISTYQYNAFGSLTNSTGSIDNKYLFAGEQYDSNLDAYYLRDRYYDSNIGRFTRRDTYEGDLNNPISLNKYLYANANPVLFIDPSGFISTGIGETSATLNLQSILMSLLAASIAGATLTGDSARRDDNCEYSIDEHHLFYPDTRFGGVTGFHSTARTIEGIDYYWITEPPMFEADYEPFSARWGIPETQLVKVLPSSFFPMKLTDSQVLKLIGEAYIKGGCPASGAWSGAVINPLIGEPIAIQGTVLGHYIKTVFPAAY
jgi:RHS repeat-associated protein